MLSNSIKLFWILKLLTCTQCIWIWVESITPSCAGINIYMLNDAHITHYTPSSYLEVHWIRDIYQRMSIGKCRNGNMICVLTYFRLYCVWCEMIKYRILKTTSFLCFLSFLLFSPVNNKVVDTIADNWETRLQAINSASSHTFLIHL